MEAAYQTVMPGETITIGEFVFEDDYSAASDPCAVTIFNPSNVIQVNAQNTTVEASGWQYYEYSVAADAPLGNWPAVISCGSELGGDLIKADKTFTVIEIPDDTASTTIATAVWNNSTRTLSSFGALAADVWNGAFAPTRRLTDSTLTDGGNIGTLTDIQNASSSLGASLLVNRTLIQNLNNISAADVWAVGTRQLTDATLSSGSLATLSDVQSASSSINSVVSNASSSLGIAIQNNTSPSASEIATEVWSTSAAGLTGLGTVGKLVADNIDVAISTRGTSNLTASDVWNAATRTLTDYATSSIASYAATAVWANGTRTLTNYGNDITAANVWDTLTSSLSSVNTIGKLLVDNIDTTISSRASLANQIAGWTIEMSDYSAVQAGETYRAKVEIRNSNSVPTAPFAAPRVTLYDAERNVTVSSVAMTSIATGVYEYTYSVSSSASQGVWEAVIETEVESGKTLQNNDYWIVAGSPAQVIINSVTANSISDISANLTITNEGLAGYEYHYEWCVVSNSNNACGDGDDEYHGTGAKFINPGEDWITDLTATVDSAGDYYFKVIVYFGTEQSGSSRSFSVAGGGGGEEPPSGGGGGGGGGGGSTGVPQGEAEGADFNGDNIVNSVDFSILLAFWKTNPPFANPAVDINHDNAVNSIDFSILLSQWGTSGTPL